MSAHLSQAKVNFILFAYSWFLLGRSAVRWEAIVYVKQWRGLQVSERFECECERVISPHRSNWHVSKYQHLMCRGASCVHRHDDLCETNIVSVASCSFVTNDIQMSSINKQTEINGWSAVGHRVARAENHCDSPHIFRGLPPNQYIS